MIKKLIEIEHLGKTPLRQSMLTRYGFLIEKLFSIDRINSLYSHVSQASSHAGFLQSSLASLGVSFNLSPRDLASIPLKGPTVVVANHPFGALDGIVLGTIFTSLRRDVKILGNYLLKEIPELKDLVIAVDPFGARGAARNNVKPLLEAVRWLRDGGMLLVFPGRQVSHLRLTEGGVSDAPWSPTVAGLIRRSEAIVSPVYFAGYNSLTFQLAGVVSPLLRTLLLPRELFNKRSSQVDVRIGPPVAWRRLKEFDCDERMINHLRLRTYILANRPALEPASRRRPGPLEELPVVREVIVPPVLPRLLSTEIGALPQGQRLERVGGLAVYYAEAGQIPNTLREIGRLRETTFRAEDEGTGRSLDNDSYDGHYVHLFLWNSEKEEIVGAYRMGLVPDILRRFGTEGLYTSLLFRYRSGLWDRWRHSIELGRAFVRPEYQRQHAPLLTLWRGIFRFVSRHPNYNILFGPLSISRAYSQASKSAIELYARVHLSDPALAGLVSAHNPFRPSRLEGMKARFFTDNIRNLDDLSSVVSSIEPDGKGIPVLFRQYAKFDFRILAFNVNKYFSSTVDGLMYVDLTRTDSGKMRRLIGAGAYADYASHHLALSR